MRKTRLGLSRRTASRLLDDPAAHARDGGLGELLSAAAGRHADLGAEGEERAVALFRSVAHPETVPTHGGTSVMTRFTRKVAAAPAAVLAAVGMVVAGGGIALAASQGALQVPFTGHDNRPADAPSATATVNPGLTRTPAAEPSDGIQPGLHRPDHRRRRCGPGGRLLREPDRRIDPPREADPPGKAHPGAHS
jgi:hypothetical protein